MEMSLEPFEGFYDTIPREHFTGGNESDHPNHDDYPKTGPKRI